MKIGIISDIHEDYESLTKAFKILELNKCDEIICLGDIVGYSTLHYDFPDTKNASECIKLIKSNCKIVVLGNHDLYTIKRTPIYYSDFKYPENWYELDMQERLDISRDKLWDYSFDDNPNIKDSEIDFLMNLKELETAEYGDCNIMFSHFIYPDLSGSTTYIPSRKSDFKDHFKFMSEYKCRISFFGHGHYNGSLLTNKSKNRIKDFGVFDLREEINCISVPCIVKGKQKNGVLVFDISRNQIETIKL